VSRCMDSLDSRSGRLEKPGRRPCSVGICRRRVWADRGLMSMDWLQIDLLPVEGIFGNFEAIRNNADVPVRHRW